MGVDVQHGQLSFYKDAFKQDVMRVNKLFFEAQTSNMIVEQKTIPLAEVKQYLEAGNLVILLVDLQFLKCVQCVYGHDPFNGGCSKRKRKKFRSSFGCFDGAQLLCCLPQKGEYLGHYILLCCYHKNEDMFEYKDPAKDASSCFVATEELDIARKSVGTDEDIIFVGVGS